MSADIKSARADFSELPLREVIQRLRSGRDNPESSTAATEIVRRFQPLLRKYWIRQRIGEYQDFMQEVMVRLFAALPYLRTLEAFPGLFRRITQGVAADILRRPEAKIQPGHHDEGLASSQLSIVSDALSTALVVRSYLEYLPSREREVVRLLFFEDLDVADVALRLKITEGAVRMSKSRAIGRLRTLFMSDDKNLKSGDANGTSSTTY